jgi:hypothetical protein
MPYYCVHVSNRAGTKHQGRSLIWSPPMDTPGKAQRRGQALLGRGEATLTFVVELSPGRREVLPRFTKPESADKIICHYLKLARAVAGGGALPGKARGGAPEPRTQDVPHAEDETLDRTQTGQ